MPGPQTFVLRRSRDFVDETSVCTQPLNSKKNNTTNILNIIKLLAARCLFLVDLNQKTTLTRRQVYIYKFVSIFLVKISTNG